MGHFLPSLRIKQKLLLFWMVSILFLLLFLGYSLSLLVSDRYLEQAQGKIGKDFRILATELETIRSKLQHNAGVLAVQSDVVAITSLVNSYQDLKSYQPLVFDGEKERLAQLLLRQAEVGGLRSVAVYDSKGDLVACSSTTPAGERYAGYSTVVDGQLTYRSIGQNRGSAEQCPQGKKVYVNSPGREQITGYQVREGELVIGTAIPVMRHLPDGVIRLIGTLRICEYLDETFVSHIGEHTKDDFMLYMGDGMRLGSIKESLPAVPSDQLPRLDEVNKSRSESGWLDSEEYFIGLVRMDMEEGDPVVFAFGVSKEELAKNFEAFKKSIMAVMLVITLIVLPFGVVVLNRVISRPIERLAFGVQTLERGEYVELESEDGSDELSQLARSFNTMSSALQSREEGLRKLSMAVEQSPVSVLITSPHGIIEYVNDSFVEISGYSREEVVGATPRLLKSGHTSQEQYRQLWETVLAGKVWRGQFCNKRKDGTLFWEEAVISPVKDAAGQITHLIAVKEDITIRKSYEEQLLHQANYDSLTGLPNRLLALDRLTVALAYAKRHDLAVAVLFVDLDDFKLVNDTLGHVVGDKLLVEVAKRFSQVMRDGDTVARLGGDEFLVVVPDVVDPQEAETISEKVINTLLRPIELEGRMVYIGASVGVSLYPEDGQDSTILMRNADSAMYMAKEGGRNTFRFFTSAMNENALRRMDMESRLRLALDKGEFSVHFQPQVRALTGNLSGVEALLRWSNPVLGQVPPDIFIALAEDIGIIHEIGAWVLESACRQVCVWNEELETPLRVAVNVSPLQFRDQGLVDMVQRVLEKTCLPSELLELELTEGVLMDSNPEKDAMLGNLKALGITLTLDDFGTGYSSLSYLRRFPFDVLKIDRSFIRDITVDPADAELTHSIITMAHILKLQVVAEGVETVEQLRFLQQYGCDLIQGHLTGRPLAASEFKLQSADAVDYTKGDH